jgi:hypothetical protein
MLAISFGLRAGCSAFRSRMRRLRTGGSLLRLAGPEPQEALHALRVEALRPPLEGPPGGRAGVPGSPVRRSAEQHQGADELVVPLLGPAAQELDLLPLVGRRGVSGPVAARLRFPLATRLHDLWQRRGIGSMPQARLRGQYKYRYTYQTSRRGLN